jgi:long-chain acyl-CoA synthetase
MLSHGNIVADYSAAIQAGLHLTKEDVHLSYLPLAHMFERLVQAVLWVEGSSVGFYQGSALKVMEDLQALHPTLFPSVPR